MSDQPMTYGSAGVDYHALDAFKRACQREAAATLGVIGGSSYCRGAQPSPALSWPAAYISIPSLQNAPPANSGRSSFFLFTDLNFDDSVN